VIVVRVRARTYAGGLVLALNIFSLARVSWERARVRAEASDPTLTSILSLLRRARKLI